MQGGNHIVMHIPGEGTGMGVTQVKAIWGINLIAWRVHPIQAKSIWAGANQQWFSFLSGQWIEMAKKFGGQLGGIGAAAFRLPNAAPNSQMAGNQTDGADGKFHGGSDAGRVTIVGEPSATAIAGKLVIEKVRPGVDGTYTIVMAEHVYSRSAGYVTNLTVNTDGNAQGSASVYNNGYEQTFRPAEPATIQAPSPIEQTFPPGSRPLPTEPTFPPGPQPLGRTESHHHR